MIASVLAALSLWSRLGTANVLPRNGAPCGCRMWAPSGVPASRLPETPGHFRIVPRDQQVAA